MAAGDKVIINLSYFFSCSKGYLVRGGKVFLLQAINGNTSFIVIYCKREAQKLYL